jgi:hypothetical protein
MPLEGKIQAARSARETDRINGQDFGAQIIM